jgi:hypothetical protein
METKNQPGASRPRRRKRVDPADDSLQQATSPVALSFVVGMAVIGLVCLIVGFVKHGSAFRNTSQAAASLTLGVACVAIGLLEVEWLEKIVDFAWVIYFGFTGWMWWGWSDSSGTLSDSEWLGRRGATTVWMLFGIPIFVVGCLLALHVFEI